MDMNACRKEYLGPFSILPGTSLEDVKRILSDIVGMPIEKIDNFGLRCSGAIRGKLIQEPDGSFSIGDDTIEPGMKYRNIDKGIADLKLLDNEGNTMPYKIRWVSIYPFSHDNFHPRRTSPPGPRK